MPFPIDRIVASTSPGETRLALLAGDDIVELWIDRGQAAVGDIRLGQIRGMAPGHQAAFIEIGEALPGFLPSAGHRQDGETILVQVTAPARRDKGAALTADLLLQSAFWLYSPDRRRRSLPASGLGASDQSRCLGLLPPALPDPDGAVAPRPTAQTVADDRLRADLGALLGRATALRDRACKDRPPCRLDGRSLLESLLADHPTIEALWVDDAAMLAEARRLLPAAQLVADGFDHCGAQDALDAALSPCVALPGGGKITIDETAGGTMIDIDAGGRPAQEANLAAIPVILAEIRRRGLAGHLLIDVIPGKNRKALDPVLEALKQRLAGHPGGLRLVGVTPLGLLELTAERRRTSLGDLLLAQKSEPMLNDYTIALNGLRALLRAVRLRPAVWPTLVARPSVIAELQRRPTLLQQAAERLGRPPSLRADAQIPMFDLAEDPR